MYVFFSRIEKKIKGKASYRGSPGRYGVLAGLLHLYIVSSTPYFPIHPTLKLLLGGSPGLLMTFVFFLHI